MNSIVYNKNGATLKLPTGFSWTTFIFGWWPSIIRSHWRMAWACIAVDLIALWLVTAVFNGNDYMLSPIIMRGILGHFRNKELHHDAKKDGWRVVHGVTIMQSSAND